MQKKFVWACLAVILFFFSHSTNISAAELITNGGFETGNFTGWTFFNSTNPWNGWRVSGPSSAACCFTSVGNTTTAPGGGSFNAWNGMTDFTSNTQWQMYQPITVPAGQGIVVSWFDRYQVNHTEFCPGGNCQPKYYFVEITDTLGNILQVLHIQATIGNVNQDIDWSQHSVRIPSRFAGQTVRLRFRGTETITLSGPGHVEIDNVSVQNYTPTTRTVTKTADTNDGVCNADCSLREAITVAASGDIVNFSTLFDSAQIITLTSALPVINKDLVINGPVNKVQITKDGSFSGRIFDINGTKNTSVELKKLEIFGGNPTASNGGAIRISGGVVTVENCILRNNSATNGGGISAENNLARLRLVNSSVSNNSSTNLGGGVYGSASFINIKGSTIDTNTVPLEGGGVWATGLLFISNSTVYGNQTTTAAGVGGGVVLNGTIVGCGLDITASTITANNSQTGTTGGVATNCAPGAGSVKIKNSIIAGNTSTTTTKDIQGSFTSAGNNLIGVSDGSVGFTNLVNEDKVGTSGTPLNPLLDTLKFNGGFTKTVAVLPGSPAINAGKSTTALDFEINSLLTIDQRGFARNIVSLADNFDIGAYERQAVTSANVTIGGAARTAKGIGISNAVVTLVEANGNLRQTRTNSFGNYSFDNVATGSSVSITIISKRFNFENPTRIVNVSENIGNLDFNEIE
ncbi:MAG TPA: choice-of-anchor Q domain-containing protein [Pyrinomonadaceae bacterium]|nr:choice-of-anchor Q domain-containing protein [Pyrinomonadaceae bacterium]